MEYYSAKCSKFQLIEKGNISLSFTNIEIETKEQIKYEAIKNINRS